MAALANSVNNGLYRYTTLPDSSGSVFYSRSPQQQGRGSPASLSFEGRGWVRGGTCAAVGARGVRWVVRLPAPSPHPSPPQRGRGGRYPTSPRIQRAPLALDLRLESQVAPARAVRSYCQILWTASESGGLEFFSVHERHPGDHVGDAVAAVKFSPMVLSRLGQFEHHRQARLA